MSALVSSASARGVPLSGQCERASAQPSSQGPSTTAKGSPSSRSHGTNRADGEIAGRAAEGSSGVATRGECIPGPVG